MAIRSIKISRGPPAETTAGARRERLYQELARKMMSAIDSGKYKVGERLPAERELAVEFDVSRATVREAIISLEFQGLVEVRLGTSAYVRRKLPHPNAHCCSKGRGTRTSSRWSLNTPR